MSRDEQRHSPTDTDQPPAKAVLKLDFDLRAPFPERYSGRRFGPLLIERSLKAGNYVIAELIDLPGQYSVSAARWDDIALQVLTINGWRTPSRLFTLKTLKGFKV